MMRADVAVVGGGIVGLAFAWEAARRGQSVVLFERSPRSQGASIRNFGMVWPIGQPPGANYRTAMRSRERWLELASAGVVWAEPCGSVHVARAADEDAVIREFAAAAPGLGIAAEYLSAVEACSRFPNLRSDGLMGVLYSPTELVVDPPAALARMPQYLAESHGVDIRFNATIVDISMPRIRTASGETWQADRVFVCSGADFETLFPAVYAASGLRRCKLQMMKTGPQPNGWKLGPHFAGGLTLCHYKSFDICPSLPALKQRIAASHPDHVRFGIHVMASQNAAGEVVIGDSHEYDAAIEPFDKAEIDELILSYLQPQIDLPDPTIRARWHGIYAKHPTRLYYSAEPQPGCQVISSPGGAGMTLSFGVAADWWDKQ